MRLCESRSRNYAHNSKKTFCISSLPCVVQVANGRSDDEAGSNGDQVISDSDTDHGSAAEQKSKSKDRASLSRNASRDSLLQRTRAGQSGQPATKAVEGRKRLRKAS